MKILWICNIPLPEASILMKKEPQPYGGWLVNLSRLLVEQDDMNLYIAFPEKSCIATRVLQGKKITYIAFPVILPNKNDEVIDELLQQVHPDILHIWGTESYHCYSATKLFNDPKRTVINIQGLLSIYAQHYYSSLPLEIINACTFRDIIRQDNITQQKKKFDKKGEYEINSLKLVNHIIGRTSWDKACVQHINPQATYHFCNEILREPFYKNRWNISACKRNSIFVSQGHYPIKGFHFVLEALSIILEQFPDTHLFVAGHSTKSYQNINRLRMSSYTKYINSLIKKYDLEEHITFLGTLSDDQMCHWYLNSHVFVSASSIENESNSLSEARMLGLPGVASYVGGVTDRINHKVDGFLYPYDEPYMLAYYVKEIFSDDELALSFSDNSHKAAELLHDMNLNVRTLKEIYKEMLISK